MTAPNYFIPQQMPIATIIRGLPTIVVTNIPHNYHTGLIVRIVLPLSEQSNGQVQTALNSSRGMSQIDGQVAEITVVANNGFTIPIDSTNFDDYDPMLNPTDYQYVGQVIPVAEDALTLTSVTQNNYTIAPEIYGTRPAPQTI